jgi:NAD(P)-dependent dehydrogenase (short-subunit alcohol dehydrogenase family)
MIVERTQMQGKICLITGATDGIGKVTADALASRGATVIIVARNRAKGERVQQELKTKYDHPAIDLLIADLSSQASIRQLSEDFHQRYKQLHVLINNAGLIQLKRTETVDGLETTFAVNHLASFLLTNLLLDVLKASAPSRIINVNSSAHKGAHVSFDDLQSTKSYKMMSVYGESKLAQMFAMYELARRLQGTGVTVNNVHPGFVGTNIGMNNVGPVTQTIVRKILGIIGATPEHGARTSIYLATSPDVEHVTGKYFVNSIPVPSAAVSYNEALQKQMWDISAELVHLPASPQS